MRIILILLLLTPTLSKAQSIKYEDLAGLKSKVKNITEYIASDGHTYKVGDVITIGQPNGTNSFSFIRIGGDLNGYTEVQANDAGIKSEITKIYMSGNKRTGYTIWMKGKTATFLNTYLFNFEPALSSEEIIAQGYSSDKALEALKQAKDKLNLGIITQIQYDSIKSYLIPFIK